MSYLTYEQSDSSGQPVELYVFSQGFEVWRFTSAADNYEELGVVYEAAAIDRSKVEQSSDISKAGITLRFPRDHWFATRYLGITPDLVTTLTIYRLHETDTALEKVAYWKGRVISGAATGSDLSLECESVFSSLRRPGLRAKYQLTCRHVLYSAQCGIDMGAIGVSGVLTGHNGTVLTLLEADAQDDHWFTGGIVKLESGAMRFIVRHIGPEIIISRPFVESLDGALVTLFPGCDRRKATCISKFNNLLNFGGFPYIPSINPFGGTRIA